ncbi:class I SAM-dependent methyltransferase [Streptantibioticus cattleyicolor]|uniref:D-glucose O-methyltransferase n=1 Tax=Streptantibioticus cattleyicolor (strain ATCC 35852 / DSM 46488 / JCM 4925 / NBRC 14057 / NRRL 8057) TaxID=1003195 RepID=G8WZ63_STREN|nr:methyltransferase domain-containing protein [Streptantibioticus cattleyicolor]AEW93812.1 D-glucose O-methyltransferase [Streptantibioticus cattleyicolor NRRL 8057 = DSM 46488]
MVRRSEDHERPVERLYDTASELLAKSYDANLHFGYWDDFGNGSLAAAAERMTDQVIERIRVNPGQRVLDVGCGTGTPALRLARARGVEVVGISISRRETDGANERSRRAGLARRVRFDHADAMALPYATASFDAVWAIESMSHMPDRAKALGEIARGLRPGGRLVIADGFLHGTGTGPSNPVMDSMCAAFRMHSPPTLAGYEDLLASAGLRLTESTDLSRHARHSMARLTETLKGDSAEFARVLGRGTFVRLMESLCEADVTKIVGYALLTAERTADPRNSG